MNPFNIRIYDLPHNKMIYIRDLYFFEEEGIHESGGSGHHADYSDIMIGTESFYEEDIVEDDIDGTWRGIVKHGNYKIKNEFGELEEFNGWYVEGLTEFAYKEYDDFLSYKLIKREVRVIGNVFENKELL